MDIKFLIAPLMYAVSIYIDVFTYHLKFNLHDNKNFRYLFSLINVFQYSARGFILIFAPIMAYYTESVKDKDLIWLMTLLAHIFVILLLIMLYSRRYSLAISRFIISKLNFFLGKAEYKKDFTIILNPTFRKEAINFKKDSLFFGFSFLASSVYGFSMTFLYYIAFYFPQKVLMLSSYSQVLNSVGAMSLLLFIDPRMMASIDNGKGLKELNIITTSRICANFVLILILLFIR